MKKKKEEEEEEGEDRERETLCFYCFISELKPST
jgi:hypothetical protein